MIVNEPLDKKSKVSPSIVTVPLFAVKPVGVNVAPSFVLNSISLFLPFSNVNFNALSPSPKLNSAPSPKSLAVNFAVPPLPEGACVIVTFNSVAGKVKLIGISSLTF